MEAPHLRRLHKKYFARGLRVIGITALTSPLADIHAFVARHGITHPTLVDPGEKVMKLYGFRQYPATVLIDRRGVIRRIWKGFHAGDQEAVEEAVGTLLAGAAKR